MPDRDPRYTRGILSDPLDLDGGAPRVRRAPRKVPATPGLEVTVRATRRTGVVVRCDKQVVVLRDRDGRDHQVRLVDGAFAIGREAVSLVPPRPAAGAGGGAASRTASGSVAVPGAPARVARASRIMVEGVHDAELVEKVWGDDLRIEGVVVQPLEGADNLVEVVRGFGPRPGRRLGILLDHVVEGSKESRLAEAVDHPDVLVTGHPFVDVWAAVKPQVVGIPAWPDVPKGLPWKEGVCEALGVGDPRAFWKRIVGSVSSYADLEPALVGAVEQLIDFVTEPTPG